MLARGNGEVLARGYRPTPVELGPQGVLAEIASAIRETLSSAGASMSDLLGIGIAAAGIIDSREGRVVVSPNLPDWHDVPLGGTIEERFGVPVSIGNDASLAALGEWYFGVNRQIADLVYVTVSTGIGGGIIADGKLYEGVSGAAGEVGHMTIDVNGPKCRCGSSGCWEVMASGRALAEEAVRQVDGGARSSIAELVGGDLDKVDAKIVFLASQQGDELARRLIARQAYYFGVGLGNLINIFNPEIILVGGGVAKMGDALLGPASEVARERAFKTPAEAVEIRRSFLGDDSGLLGAVALVQQRGL